MTARSMRIKVRISDLIARIEAARASAEADHGEKLAAFIAAKGQALPALRAAIKAIKATDFSVDDVSSRYSGSRRRYVPCITVDLPDWVDASEPDGLDLSSFDRDINLLRMSADETISISTDDRYARYL